MKSKKIASMGLVLVMAIAMSASAFAAASTSSTKVPTSQGTSSSTKKKDSSKKKGTTGKKTSTSKSATAFVSIEKTAGEILGVSEESLAGLNHASELYSELSKAGKVNDFKTALIAAKSVTGKLKRSVYGQQESLL